MTDGNAKAVLVDDLHAPDALGKPGHFKFWQRPESDKPGGLNFWCPCGCGALLGVSFGPGRWTWNGDRERPTVRPSILHMDGCRWHGFLTDGEFREC